MNKVWIFCFVAVATLFGCGGSGGSGTTAPPFAGQWQGTGISVNVQSSGTFSGHFLDNPQSVISGTMASDHTISGTYQYPSQPVRNFIGGWSTLQGGTFLNWAVNVDGGPLQTFAFEKP